MISAESVAEVAERIRSAVPIAGATATNDECARRRELVDAFLAERGVLPGPDVWRTAQLVDGRVVGVFATSPEEAEVQLTLWWGSRCHWIVDDPESRILDEYRAVGRPGGTDRVFPLARPRVPRDRFAPAASLLDDVSVNGRETGFGLR